MFTKASVVAIFATTVAAIGTPTTLTGNPIARPGLNEIVPACQQYTITWQATSTVPVSIRLLRGPSENVVPLGEPLAVSIPNTGSFSWTPASTLEADVTHYGLQIIEDSGNFQYSTQFGISTDLCKNAPVPSSIGAGAPTEPSSAPAEGYPVASSTPAAEGYPTAPTNLPPVHSTLIPVTAPAGPTGYPIVNSTIVLPTGTMSVPSSLRPSATGVPNNSTSFPPQFTGAASNTKVGVSLLGAVAGLALML